MIFYGSRVTHIATESIFDKCASCGSHNSIELSIYQKYAHLYWIPFFPIGKTGMSVCSNCKQVLQKKEFSEELKISYQNLKSSSRTPVWMFSGLALAAVLIVWGVSVSKQNDEKYARMVVSP
jgi:hypothetical protein